MVNVLEREKRRAKVRKSEAKANFGATLATSLENTKDCSPFSWCILRQAAELNLFKAFQPKAFLHLVRYPLLSMNSRLNKKMGILVLAGIAAITGLGALNRLRAADSPPFIVTERDSVKPAAVQLAVEKFASEDDVVVSQKGRIFFRRRYHASRFLFRGEFQVHERTHARRREGEHHLPEPWHLRSSVRHPSENALDRGGDRDRQLTAPSRTPATRRATACTARSPPRVYSWSCVYAVTAGIYPVTSLKF
jgi:hypothetical protein